MNFEVNHETALSLLLYRIGPCDVCDLPRQLKLQTNGQFVCLACMNTKGNTHD